MSLSGKTICFTGALEMKRADATEAAEAAGATVAGSVTKKVDILIAGPGAGAKADKASSMGVDVWDEAQFAAAIGGGGGSSAPAPAPAAGGKARAEEEPIEAPAAKKAKAEPKGNGKAPAEAPRDTTTPAATPTSLAGHTIAFVGKLKRVSRKDAYLLATASGAAAINKATDANGARGASLVVAGEKAPSFEGLVAPTSCTILKGPTFLDPAQTRLFQALRIPYKIEKGSVLMLQDTTVTLEGNEAALKELRAKGIQLDPVPQIILTEDEFMASVGALTVAQAAERSKSDTAQAAARAFHGKRVVICCPSDVPPPVIRAVEAAGGTVTARLSREPDALQNELLVLDWGGFTPCPIYDQWREAMAGVGVHDPPPADMPKVWGIKPDFLKFMKFYMK